MDSDERAIFDYLKTWGDSFVGAREVCRRAANKKRAHEDADWARPILVRMTERGILESDAQGKYRVKPMPKKGHNHRWVSPELSKILNENGVAVEGAASLDTDEHYEQL
jgi:predicted transcriptional regulator of viral defense system